MTDREIECKKKNMFNESNVASRALDCRERNDCQGGGRDIIEVHTTWCYVIVTLFLTFY